MVLPNNLSVGPNPSTLRSSIIPTIPGQSTASLGAPAQQLWKEAQAAATYYRGSLSPALARLVHCCPSEVLANLYSRHEELEQHLIEVRRKADPRLNKLDLELNLALYRTKEAKAQVEEARDEHASQVVYEFGYQIALRCFKVRYPKFKVNEDSFAELPLDVEVPAPTEVPFDNHLATPPALPPHS
ncbi:hypothetical protein B296_00058796 [Ensete ventricosum]|uniref:Uncharacterized protein n=1 Tax=Ensete ventricosum TaxID=4639 RepID=A0A426XKG1_ENSVE|nr:hypothetical protein B296_00058796 [Ensete ventricosum]